ncbi:MAG: MotA/TolQ/ExbB proton channel family protein [Desulfarculaceae bacterium]|nr:MotA/TolQ/ExbB proton channel family protein [Desulfarculaceae bacterium]
MHLLDTAWQFFLAGGPVMWPLLVLSLWLWALMLYKFLWVARVRREGLELDDAVEDLLRGHAPPVAGPKSAALAHFMSLPGREPRVDTRLWEASVRRQEPGLWRHVESILVLASVAPLLGLLGTVSGMIETFAVIGQYGTGNAQAMAGGIREALVTTETGLLIAIPGIFAGWVLKRQVRKLQQGLLSFSGALHNWLKSREEAAWSI